jgi:hypothetical protein
MTSHNAFAALQMDNEAVDEAPDAAHDNSRYVLARAAGPEVNHG